MENGTDRWLTLPELVLDANLEETEVRRLLDCFGKFLPSRKSDDTVIYHPDAAEAIALISSLYRHGWDTREIMRILVAVEQNEGGLLDHRDVQENGGLSTSEDGESWLMLSSLDQLDRLIGKIAALATNLNAALKEIKVLNKETQALRH